MENIVARKCLSCGKTKRISKFIDGMWINTYCNVCRNANGGSKRRYQRVVKNGGKIAKEEWMALKDKYGNKCLCCGRSNVKLTLDHVVPIVLGGPNLISNAQPLCKSCNSKKHTKVIDYR